MKKITARLGVLVLISAICQSVFADYWAVGAFRSQGNAEREQARIADLTAMDVEVMQSGEMYRVVVAKNDDPDMQKMALEDLGLTPWSLGSPGAKVAAVASSSPAPRVEGAGSGYLLVLASFRDEASANALRLRMEQDNVADLGVMTRDVGGETYYRLVQGPHSNKDGVNTDYSNYGIEGAWWIGGETAAVASKAMDPEIPMMEVVDDDGNVSVVEIPDQMTSKNTGSAPAASAAVGGMAGTMAAEPQRDVVYEVSPPRANESYVDYCLRRANKMEREIYCADGSFNRIANAEKNSAEADANRLKYCALHATGRERREMCRN